jgi:hypothetical protein
LTSCFNRLIKNIYKNNEEMVKTINISKLKRRIKRKHVESVPGKGRRLGRESGGRRGGAEEEERDGGKVDDNVKERNGRNEVLAELLPRKVKTMSSNNSA